jgi:hypothetical protein
VHIPRFARFGGFNRRQTVVERCGKVAHNLAFRLPKAALAALVVVAETEL